MTGDRPRLHFTPASGWMNDPHGIVHTNGEYHLFHQAVPHAMTWRADCRWGHAAGPDLLSLRALPSAIEPGDGDDGIWTGCVVPTPDGFRAFYTAVTDGRLGIGRIRTARPVDADLTTWRKGPVVLEAPADRAVTAFRDPVVIRDDGRWWMTVGAALGDGRAAALVWESDDLEQWRPRGVAAARASSATDPWTGTLWECPQVVDLGGAHLLVTSVWADDVSYDTAWALGTWSGGRFTDERWYPLSAGGMHYAPSAFRDVDGRPCLLFWLRGVGSARDGWAGALSVPYVVGVDGDRPVLRLHPDVERHAGPEVDPADVPGTAALVEWDPGRSGRLRLDDRLTIRAGDGVLALVVGADGADDGADARRAGGAGSDDGADARRADGAAGVSADERTGPWSGGPLSVVVDGPVVEVVGRDGLLGTVVPPRDGMAIAADGRVRVRPLR